MSTLAEIEKAIETLPPEQWQEIRRWMDANAPRVAAAGSAPVPTGKTPDFLARQEALFGERILADSQAVLDELRAERV